MAQKQEWKKGKDENDFRKDAKSVISAHNHNSENYFIPSPPPANKSLKSV